MASDRINQLFWLNFAQAIKNKSGAKDGVLFLGNRVLDGPVAGDNIPEEYTNAGLFEIGNSLLSTDNLFFDPRPELGYVEALQLFLNWADLGPHFPPPFKMMISGSNRDFESAQTAYAQSLKRAMKNFARDQSMGMARGQQFDRWIASNAPDCSMANMQLQQTSARIQQFQTQGGGPDAGTVNRLRAGANSAMAMDSDRGGFNMHCASGDDVPQTELIRMFQAKSRVDTPGFIRKAAYLAPDYKTFATDAQGRVGQAIDPAQGDSVTLTISPSNDPGKYNFGQTAKVSSYPGWLSVRGPDEYSDPSTVDIAEDEASSVSVKVFFSNLKSIAISPGAWSSSDLSSVKVWSDAPQQTRTLACVSSMIAASQLGYQITVGDSLAQKLGSKLAETKNSDGVVFVFGLAAMMGDGRRGGGNVQHQAQWDSGAKTLTVRPRDDSGAATVLALIGQKVGAS